MPGCLLPHRQDCAPRCARRLWVGLSQDPQPRAAALLHRGRSLEPWCPSSRVSGLQRTGAQKPLQSRRCASSTVRKPQPAPEPAQPSAGALGPQPLGRVRHQPPAQCGLPEGSVRSWGPATSRPFPGSRHLSVQAGTLVHEVLAGCLTLSCPNLSVGEVPPTLRGYHPHGITLHLQGTPELVDMAGPGPSPRVAVAPTVVLGSQPSQGLNPDSVLSL